MKFPNVIILIVLLFNCNNPQSTKAISINVDNRLIGKWKEVNTALFYAFNFNGNYTYLDTNQKTNPNSSYTEQYRTYFERYLNITYEMSKLGLFGTQTTDTIILLDEFVKYKIFADTLIFERRCIGFTGASSTLQGNWRQIPPKLYLVKNRYVFDTSKITYLNFFNNILNTNAQWFGASFPPPYVYIDYSTSFGLQSTNIDTSYITIDYNIVDTSLFLLWPPHSKKGPIDFQSDTLIRLK